MVVQNRNILKLSDLVPKRDYIFEAYISVNGRYIVFRDEVYDLQEHRNIGNLWGSIDTFKTIFKNTDVENDEYKQIQESFLSLPILEGHENLYGLRDILLEFNFFDDTWFGRQLKGAGQGISNFASKSWNGVKKLGVAISKGDWTQILNLLKKGVLFLLRELKSALYSNLGIIIDGILVAVSPETLGATKIAQMVIWGLVLSLDIYQYISNDYVGEDVNKQNWQKLLEIGIDAVGFIVAGGFAKYIKTAFKSVLEGGSESLGRAVTMIKNNKFLSSSLEKVGSALENVPSKLNEVKSVLAKSFPKGVEFINSILGKLGNVLKSISETIGQLLGKGYKGYKTITGGATNLGKGVRAGLVGTGLTYALDPNKSGKLMSDDELKTLNKIYGKGNSGVLNVDDLNYINNYK